MLADTHLLPINQSELEFVTHCPLSGEESKVEMLKDLPGDTSSKWSQPGWDPAWLALVSVLFHTAFGDRF